MGTEEGLRHGDPRAWSWVGLGAVLAQLVGWATGAEFSQLGKEGPGVQGMECFEDGGSCSFAAGWGNGKSSHISYWHGLVRWRCCCLAGEGLMDWVLWCLADEQAFRGCGRHLSEDGLGGL